MISSLWIYTYLDKFIIFNSGFNKFRVCTSSDLQNGQWLRIGACIGRNNYFS